MAINPETQYPGKIAPSTPDYPYGAARNITVPGDGTGTPWEAALVNDIFGFQQALLSEAGIVPSGSPETATASQYLQAMKAITTRRFAGVAAMVAFAAHVDGDVYTTGGTVWRVNATAGLPLTGGLFALPLSMVNVLDWGAVRNVESAAAENANFSAFNEALAFLVSINGGSLFVPKGDYHFGASHYIRWGYSLFADAANGAVNFIGEGRGLVNLIPKLTETLGGPVIPEPSNYSEILDAITKSAFLWADRIDNAVISGFSVFMKAGRYFGVQATGERCNINNVLVDGGQLEAVPVQSAGTICAVQAKNCMITECIEQNAYDQGFYILRCDKVTLTNNLSVNQRVASFVIYGSTNCTVANNVVNGCNQGLTALSSDANARGGTQVEPHNLIVESNTFLDCARDIAFFGTGVNVSNEPYGLGYTEIIERPIVADNIITFASGGSTTADGVNIGFCNEPSIADNSVNLPPRFGVNAFNCNWAKLSGNVIKESGLTGVKIFGGIGTHVVDGNMINAPSRNSATEYGIATASANVSGNTVVFPNGEAKRALFDFGGSMFTGNAVKGDSANFAFAWLYENEIVASNAVTDRLFSVSKGSVGSTPTDVANLASTSGGFNNYIFDVEVTSSGNNRSSRYIINARGFSGGWASADLDIISEPAGAAAKITISIVGNDIVISGTQTNSATITVSVSSKNAGFTLTGV